MAKEGIDSDRKKLFFPGPIPILLFPAGLNRRSKIPDIHSLGLRDVVPYMCGVQDRNMINDEVWN